MQCALFISENAILSSLLSYCFGLCRAIYHLYHPSIRARRKMVYKAVSTNQSRFPIRTEGRPVRRAAAHNISGIASHLKNRLYPYTSHTKKNGGSFFFTFPHILLISFEHYGKLFGRIMKGK